MNSMKITLRFLFLGAIVLFQISCAKDNQQELEEQSGAGEAMEVWALYRSWPDGKISSANITAALEQRKAALAWRGPGPQWEALGPKNIGGRTLCLAFHPTNPQVIFIGSSSGGLWKTSTAGLGPNAWQRISTGYAALGVDAIAINPSNPNEMYIGTGEVYNYSAAFPGVYNRLTRGSYGVGILKSIDGGDSWFKALDWSLDELTGVWDIVLNPLNPNTVWAATTRGVYRSYDAGQTWALADDFSMATDIEIHPQDTSRIWVAHGSYQSPDVGVYYSANAGNSWSLVAGLPSDYTGRTQLSISPSQPNIMYASVADAFASIGLYKSTNGGLNWQLINAQDVAVHQGWYSHDVAIQPNDPNTIIYAGLDVHKSTDGGATLLQKSYWYKWQFGQTAVGGPEGPFDYVHGDVHGLYFSPFNSNEVFAVTDGGVFYSGDAGESWEGRNGNYQSQQFYANFSSSTTDPYFAIGGLQDNATAIYIGDDAWVRVLGGDGMSTAIDPTDDNIVWGSSQGLSLYKSVNKGMSFNGNGVTSASGEAKNFNGPFQIAPSQTNIVYAGAQRLHRSNNGGANWEATTSDAVDNGNSILTIAVSPLNPNLIYIGTAPNITMPRIFKSENGGATWITLSNTLGRTPMDITFDPNDDQIVYVVFSGYNNHHVFRTLNGGGAWETIDSGLPDVPTNTIFINPNNSQQLFVGNDIGVYASFDGGQNWEPYGEGPADAVMVMDLSWSEANQKMRIATHGLGAYQVDLVEPTSTINKPGSGETVSLENLFPNPAQSDVTASWSMPSKGKGTIRMYDTQGKAIRNILSKTWYAGSQQVEIPVGDLAGGAYVLVLEGALSGGKPFRSVRTFIKQ